MKKKKKKGKKGGFDLEAFEKELGEKGQDDTQQDGIGGDDDADLGDDPFGRDVDDDKKDAADQLESWHGTDRDYTYQEVSRAVRCPTNPYILS